MSTLLLAPFNDSMRLGQGYNSFMQTPCLGNAVDINNATFVESKNGSTPSQTVSYSARFVEKMSDVVRAMNISAGSSIRTGSVSVSGGGNNIDEMKFAESDLNAVISVKVVNQTRNLRDNISFKEIGFKDMDSTRFHDIYGDAFISGFIEGGDLHGIISIKSIDASRKSEVKSKLRSQFNGTNSEWSPSSSADLSEALRQAEVTVTVNWSGGGMIKPPNEEWTIESLIRAASAFSDNVSQCPQRTWAILTRYDTVPNFVVWSSGFNPPICVKRYEGVQRFTSELLDMYIEYKGNLFILNDAIRHQDRYEKSSRTDGVDMALSSLIDARKDLRAEMSKIVGKIETLDRNPAMVIELLGKEDVIAPELWRARLPFRKDNTSDAMTQNVLESLFQGLPIHAEIDKKPDLSEQLETKALQMKLAQLEAANSALLSERLDTKALQVKLTGLEETNSALAKNLDSANMEIAEFRSKQPPPPLAVNSVDWWLREGLCPPKQQAAMPRYIREWAIKNATKWPDYRISWTSAGLQGIENDGSSNFQCSLDHIERKDGHVTRVEVFMREKYLCGLRIHYASNKTVEHGDCTAPLRQFTGYAFNAEIGFIIARVTVAEGRPNAIYLDTYGCEVSAIKCPGGRFQMDCYAAAPPRYFLRGFWTQYEGDGFERLGLIWGQQDIPERNPSEILFIRP